MTIDPKTAAALTSGAMASFHPFRTLMPYCVTAVSGGWVFENRWYAPLGSRQSAAAKAIPLHTFRFYLYNDSAESRVDYFPRLERLMTFIKPLPFDPPHWSRRDGPEPSFWDWVQVAPAPDLPFGREVLADLVIREPDEHGRRQVERTNDPAWNAAHRGVLERIELDYLTWLTSGRPMPRRRKLPRAELERLAAISGDMAV
jgi:hypothetical protein